METLNAEIEYKTEDMASLIGKLQLTYPIHRWSKTGPCDGDG